MDSPSSNASLPSDHYQNTWILPEESIIFSQPTLVLLDMEKEKKHEADVSVIIDDEQSDEVFHPIHGRPDSVVYPFKKDPTIHCESAGVLYAKKWQAIANFGVLTAMK